jgi:hypothetical protein
MTAAAETARWAASHAVSAESSFHEAEAPRARGPVNPLCHGAEIARSIARLPEAGLHLTTPRHVRRNADLNAEHRSTLPYRPS